MTSEEQAARDARDRATAASVAADEATAKLAKANEAQVAADQKAADDEILKTPVVISGRAGGAFSIDGPGLGSSGTLFIGGRMIPTTRWDNNSIRGILPPNVAGPIRLQTDNGVRQGMFPTPKVNVVTKTTTVETVAAPPGTVLSLATGAGAGERLATPGVSGKDAGAGSGDKALGSGTGSTSPTK